VVRLGPITIPWPGKAKGDPRFPVGHGDHQGGYAEWDRSHRDDPYWEHFIKAVPADMANSVVEMIRKAPDGNVFPTKTELHTPEITAHHTKELAYYCGADLIGVVRLDPSQPENEGWPFAVITAVRADHDPQEATGIGGQVPVQNGLYVTFVVSAWIRELGFRATALVQDPYEAREKLAAQAGLGILNAEGRLVVPELGTRVYVADLIRTDIPLATDG